MGRLFVILLLLILVLSATNPALAQDDTTWLVQQINTLRGGLGLGGYALNAQLTSAATQHSEYMATTCDIAHNESNGSTPASRAAANGYVGDHVSENIYGGSNAKATDAWNFWINSPVHYAGLVHGLLNEVGVGIAHGPCGHYYTLLFGHRADVNAPPAPAAASGGQPAVQPTQKPYVPPPPSRTPTATIPTFTPSPTWTLTPTHHPSLTIDAGQADAATAVAIAQQTALAYEVAALASPTVTTEPPTQTPPPTATETPVTPTETITPTMTPTLAPVEAVEAEPTDDFEVRDLIPFALLGQAILVGLVGLSFFRRSR
ncbi:MAG TPA: CAP domain-containing protein [Aggregatilineaceae bacterium]|nr:CAP domain-containing protein [Aggregatilineaceae bacterium]